MKKLIFFTLVLSLVQGETIIVDQFGNGDYLTIQEGIYAAASYDTVLVMPGTYIESITITSSDQSIYLTGINAASVQIWNSDHCFNIDFANNVTIANFTITSSSSSGIHISADVTNNFNIINNIITDCSYSGIHIQNSGDWIEISNNIIKDNGWSGLYHNSSMSNINITNNVFYHNESSDIYATAGIVIANNIIQSLPNNWSISMGGSNLQNSYNCVFGGTGWDNCAMGIGSITADPLLLDPSNNDFRLNYDDNSPCIDAGNPTPLYNDLDGSRNDMGTFGGSLSWYKTGPIVFDLLVSPTTIMQGDTITIQATGSIE